MVGFLDDLGPREPRRERRGLPPDDVIERLPVVPYVPFRCPKCGGVPRTYGRSGKTRYHHCPSCRINYLSLECNAGDVEGFTDSASLN